MFETLDKDNRKNYCIQLFYWDLQNRDTFEFNLTPSGLNAIKGSKFDKIELNDEEAVNLCHVLRANLEKDGVWRDTMVNTAE